MSAAKLSENIAAYAYLRDELEMDHAGEWVLVYNKLLVGTYKTPELAIDVAVSQFGSGPYLIREIGASPPVLSAAALYQPVHA